MKNSSRTVMSKQAFKRRNETRSLLNWLNMQHTVRFLEFWTPRHLWPDRLFISETDQREWRALRQHSFVKKNVIKKIYLISCHLSKINGNFFKYDKETFRQQYNILSLHLYKCMPCPFTGCKMFCASQIFLCRTKHLFTYCASHKHFVPDKKMICIQ